MNIPKEVESVIKELESRGFDACIVGGCVRDLLLARTPKDWDVTTNAKPEDVRNAFEDSFYENQFGTVSVMTGSEEKEMSEIEVTTYRIEGKYTDKRHPDEIRFADTLEEDLGRRDFTINAMAVGAGRDSIIDLFGGQGDLRKKIIRAVGEPNERFREDALRMMRAVRLATELGFTIEDKTLQAIRDNLSLIEFVAKERIWDEFAKLIRCSNAYDGIVMLKDAGLLRVLFPELAEGIGVTQNKHHIYTVFEHNALSLKWAAEHDYPFRVRLAALFHDIGKTRTKKGDGPDSTFYGHEIAGARVVSRMLTRFKVSGKLEHEVSMLVKYHMFYYNVGEVTERSVRRLVAKVGPENVEDLVRLRICDRMGSGVPKPEPYRQRHFQYMVEKVQRDPISPRMLKVNGNDVMQELGIGPGPKVGLVLAILLDDVLDNPKRNSKKHLIGRVKDLGDMNDEELNKISKESQEKNSQYDKAVDENIKGRYWVH